MTKEQKNTYEELIDQMMIEEVAGLDSDIAETLKGLSTNKKRLAILSILDKDRDMFVRIKKAVQSEDVSKTEHIKNVVEMLREYIKVGEVEKKAFGEVMTPISLVNDMLNTLPKEVWSNPDLKWLDPCGGCGVFPSVIVERLMEGLSTWEKDEEKRYRHIVENMLYVCELQPKNLFLFLCAFDPQDEYGLNVFNGSFLGEQFDNHMKDVWGVEKFNVIVMNPPYNTGSDNKGSAHVLWNKFVVKSINQVLINDGYLVAVHPDGWRALDGGFKSVQKLLKSRELIYLEMHNEKDGIKTFGAETTYDFYCLKNSDNKGVITKVKTQENNLLEINLSSWEFIPNGMFDEFEKLITLNDNEKVNLLYTCNYHTQKDYISKIKDDKHIYPVVYTTNKAGELNCRWSSRNDKGCFGIPKIIWSNGRASSPVIDINGDYMQTQFAYSIIDEPKNLNNIKKAMESDKFKKLMYYSGGKLGHRYNRKVISTFRKDFWKEFVNK